MYVSKTISIELEDLVTIKNFVYKKNYSNISEFFRQAVKNQIKNELKD